jgi:hypothetical protein
MQFTNKPCRTDRVNMPQPTIATIAPSPDKTELQAVG